MQDDDVTRRALFAAGALGAFAAAGSAAAAPAAGDPSSAAEAANLKLVEAFCHSWAASDFDPDKVMPAYIAEGASVRVMDSMPAVTGPAAVAAAFKPFLQKGERFRVEVLSSFAKGPIVANHRIDTQVAPGQPDKRFEVVGVFLVKDGKIQEWTDYVVA